MYLEKEDLIQLRTIAVELLDYARLKRLIADLGYNIEQYSLESNLELVTMEVLQSANQEGWIDRFITELRHRSPAVPKLAAFQPTIPPPFTAAAPQASEAAILSDHYSVVFVDNRPFLDRSKLRATLKMLTGAEGPRILTIQGQPRSGKTYTQYLIRHLGKKIGFEVIPIDLMRFDELTPLEIGASINSRMTLPDPPPAGHEQWSRWTRKYFDTLVGHIRKNPEVSKTCWWIVFDNFKAVSVPEDINDFVDALSIRINEELHNVRAVLISYERDLPSEVTPIVTEDRTTDQIGVPELAEFFIQFYSDHVPHVSARDRPTAAAAKVTEVLVSIGQNLAGIERLGEELQLQCRKILYP